MKYLTVIMITLALSIPARADILIFKTKTSGQQLDVANKIVEKKSERGYLVLNADMSNSDSVTISEADYLHYEKKGASKTQFTQILDTDDVEIMLVNFGKSNKKMILRWFDQPTGSYTVVYGTATSKDLGGFNRFVATSVLGSGVWRQVDFRTGSGPVRLTLDIKATRVANLQSKTVQDVIGEYEQLLETQGYSAE
jgi:hypothetical protein